MTAAVISPPHRSSDAANIHDATMHAHAHGQHLVHRGDGDVFVSPRVLPGWFEVGVRITPARAMPNAGALEVAA